MGDTGASPEREAGCPLSARNVGSHVEHVATLFSSKERMLNLRLFMLGLKREEIKQWKAIVNIEKEEEDEKARAAGEKRKKAKNWQPKEQAPNVQAVYKLKTSYIGRDAQHANAHARPPIDALLHDYFAYPYRQLSARITNYVRAQFRNGVECEFIDLPRYERDTASSIMPNCNDVYLAHCEPVLPLSKYSREQYAEHYDKVQYTLAPYEECSAKFETLSANFLNDAGFMFICSWLVPLLMKMDDECREEKTENGQITAYGQLPLLLMLAQERVPDAVVGQNLFQEFVRANKVFLEKCYRKTPTLYTVLNFLNNEQQVSQQLFDRLVPPTLHSMIVEHERDTYARFFQCYFNNGATRLTEFHWQRALPLPVSQLRHWLQAECAFSECVLLDQYRQQRFDEYQGRHAQCFNTQQNDSHEHWQSAEKYFDAHYVALQFDRQRVPLRHLYYTLHVLQDRLAARTELPSFADHLHNTDGNVDSFLEPGFREAYEKALEQDRLYQQLCEQRRSLLHELCNAPEDREKREHVEQVEHRLREHSREVSRRVIVPYIYRAALRAEAWRALQALRQCAVFGALDGRYCYLVLRRSLLPTIRVLSLSSQIDQQQCVDFPKSRARIPLFPQIMRAMALVQKCVKDVRSPASDYSIADIVRSCPRASDEADFSTYCQELATELARPESLDQWLACQAMVQALLAAVNPRYTSIHSIWAIHSEYMDHYLGVGKLLSVYTTIDADSGVPSFQQEIGRIYQLLASNTESGQEEGNRGEKHDPRGTVFNAVASYCLPTRVHYLTISAAVLLLQLFNEHVTVCADLKLGGQQRAKVPQWLTKRFPELYTAIRAFADHSMRKTLVDDKNEKSAENRRVHAGRKSKVPRVSTSDTSLAFYREQWSINDVNCHRETLAKDSLGIRVDWRPHKYFSGAKRCTSTLYTEFVVTEERAHVEQECLTLDDIPFLTGEKAPFLLLRDIYALLFDQGDDVRDAIFRISTRVHDPETTERCFRRAILDGLHLWEFEPRQNSPSFKCHFKAPRWDSRYKKTDKKNGETIGKRFEKLKNLDYAEHMTRDISALKAQTLDSYKKRLQDLADGKEQQSSIAQEYASFLTTYFSDSLHYELRSAFVDSALNVETIGSFLAATEWQSSFASHSGDIDENVYFRISSSQYATAGDKQSTLVVREDPRHCYFYQSRKHRKINKNPVPGTNLNCAEDGVQFNVQDCGFSNNMNVFDQRCRTSAEIKKEGSITADDGFMVFAPLSSDRESDMMAKTIDTFLHVGLRYSMHVEPKCGDQKILEMIRHCTQSPESALQQLYAQCNVQHCTPSRELCGTTTLDSIAVPSELLDIVSKCPQLSGMTSPVEQRESVQNQFISTTPPEAPEKRPRREYYDERATYENKRPRSNSGGGIQRRDNRDFIRRGSNRHRTRSPPQRQPHYEKHRSSSSARSNRGNRYIPTIIIDQRKKMPTNGQYTHAKRNGEREKKEYVEKKEKEKKEDDDDDDEKKNNRRREERSGEGTEEESEEEYNDYNNNVDNKEEKEGEDREEEEASESDVVVELSDFTKGGKGFMKVQKLLDELSCE